MALSDPALDAHQHVARDRQHDESDDEQEEAERNQGRRIEVAGTASVNSLAIARDGGAWMQDGGETLCALPMTKVTAIVSPSAARGRASRRRSRRLRV